MIYEIFVKLFILGARFFMYPLDVLGARKVHAHVGAPNV